MAYKALYRKYRPQTFEEVVGQEYIVETLKNAVNNDKLAHAYLFCGPRGTGKTTVAKILAKMVNCLSDGDKPCDKCENCLEIQQSRHPDVIEMDAASNNGVDEIRELIEKVKYAPINGKYKVYIIDEVHMMTSSAFNALLKTLEEPPKYCLFILATTEPQKILPTIISRCQRFDFKKIPDEKIVLRLKEVCKKENIKITDNALKLIARLADGGMRDSLSILDQCIAYKENDIDEDDVGMVYGVASAKDKIKILEYAKDSNSEKAIELVNSLANNGVDINRLTTDLINIVKEAVIYDYSGKEKLLTQIKGKEAKKILDMFDSDTLLKFVDVLSDMQSRYQLSTGALTYLQIGILKMMNLNKSASKPVEPKVEQKVVLSTPSEYIEYEDEKYYQILVNANKSIKEIDNKIISNLPTSQFAGKEKTLIEKIKNMAIMASSNEDIIFVADDRKNANEINEKENNSLIKNALGKFLQRDKEVIAVTWDQRDYLITYFKRKQSEIKKDKAEELKPESTEDKMKKLFGENGYDVVGD